MQLLISLLDDVTLAGAPRRLSASIKARNVLHLPTSSYQGACDRPIVVENPEKMVFLQHNMSKMIWGLSIFFTMRHS